MNSLRALTLVLGSSFFIPASPAADTATPPAAAKNVPAKTVPAGAYVGEWKNHDGGSSGALRITLKQDAEARWTAEASFSFEGADVPCTFKSIQVDGAKLTLVFTWKLQDTAGESQLTGEWQNDALAGKYETSAAEGKSDGTWKVTRA